MMLPIALALLAPALYALTNVIDSYLSNKSTMNIIPLVFYGSMFNVLLLPIVVCIEPPTWPSLQSIPAMLGIALIELLYVYPYFKALRYSDTSTVSSLFELGKLFVPLFAFFLVHERLQLIQYLGLGLIIISSIGLSWTPHMRFRLSQSFWYMLLASGLLALQAVLYKYAIQVDTWTTSFFWPTVFLFFLTLLMLLYHSWRQDIIKQYSQLKKVAWLFITVQSLAFIASVMSTYAISRLPVSVEKSLESIQPLFVMALGLLVARSWPHVIQEASDRSSLTKKIVLFLLMGAGVWLVV